MLLSFGFSPGSQGGTVKMWNALRDEGFLSLWNETLDRPLSIVRVVRWETLVRAGPAGLRNDNIVTSNWRDGTRSDIGEGRGNFVAL